MALNQLRYIVKRGQIINVKTRPDYVDNLVLAATVAKEITVPTSAMFMELVGDSDFWINFSLTQSATIPITITDGTGAVRLSAGVKFAYNVSPAEK